MELILPLTCCSIPSLLNTLPFMLGKKNRRKKNVVYLKKCSPFAFHFSSLVRFQLRSERTAADGLRTLPDCAGESETEGRARSRPLGRRKRLPARFARSCVKGHQPQPSWEEVVGEKKELKTSVARVLLRCRVQRSKNQLRGKSDSRCRVIDREADSVSFSAPKATQKKKKRCSKISTRNASAHSSRQKRQSIFFNLKLKQPSSLIFKLQSRFFVNSVPVPEGKCPASR